MQRGKNELLGSFLKYVSLNVLGMIGLSCYILGDTFFIALGLGNQGLAALNLAIPVYSFIHGIGLMIGMGGGTRYAILKAGENQKKMNLIYTQTLMWGFILGIILMVIGLLFSENLSSLLGANAEIHGMTRDYLRILLIFAPAFIMNNAMIFFIRNDQNPKLAMFAMLIGSFSNIILDYIFIFPFEMGMVGAAVATGIAPIISLMVLSVHFLRKKNKFKSVKTKLSFIALKDISSLGVAALITEISSGIVIIVFNIVILRLLGNLGVAAYGVIANLALVATGIYTGISQGMQPLMSHNYGIKDFDKVKKVYHYGIVVSFIFAMVIYGICFCFPDQIIGIFNKEGNVELLEIARNGLKLYFIAFAFVGINIVTATYFSSTAKIKEAFGISLCRGFILIIPLTLVLSSFFGINGVWIAFPVTEMLTAGISLMLKRKVGSHS